MNNAVGLVKHIGSEFDCAVNEQCQTYNECGKLAPFTAANKAVFLSFCLSVFPADIVYRGSVTPLTLPRR